MQDDTKDGDDARPTVANADRPSETAGLPGVGEGASARHFARDMVQGQVNDGEGEDRGPHAPAEPRNMDE